MPNFGGGVSGKFGGINGHDSNCIVRNQFGIKRQTANNMEGESEPEHCIKPSKMFGAFGGNGQNVKNGDDKEKGPPKAPAKKKRTTFTWVPANKDEQNAKDGAPADTKNTDIVCENVDKTYEDKNEDATSKDENVDTTSKDIAANPDSVQGDGDQDNNASKSSNCSSKNVDNSQSSHSGNGANVTGFDRVDSTNPCERTSSPVHSSGLDANANPECDVPQNWQSLDSTSNNPGNLNEPTADSSEDKEPADVIPPPPPPSEDCGGQNVTEVIGGECQVPPIASPQPEDDAEGRVVKEEDVENQDGEAEAPPRPSPPQPQAPVHHQNHNGPAAEDHRLRQDINSHQMSAGPPRSSVPDPPAAPPAPPAPQAPAAPPAPPVPQASPQPPSPPNSAPPPPGAPPAAPPAPPGPPPPPGGAGGPPPPPPPPPPPGSGGSSSGGGGGNDLAAQLAAAKLRKAPPKDDAKPRSGGPAGPNMMADLQRRLKERQKRAAGGDDAKPAAPTPAPSSLSDPKPGPKKPWESKQPAVNKIFGNTNGTPGSPKPGRRGSVNNNQNGGGSSPENIDFDRMKQEIMVEMRKEISKMKEDIIEAIKMELNRR